MIIGAYNLGMTITEHRMNPDHLEPAHEVRSEAYAAELAESMRANGWQGAPVVIVERDGADPLAVTGSHRIAAARAADILIPIVYLADITDAHGIDLAGLIEGAPAFEFDTDLAVFQAAYTAAELLPTEVETAYGLDLHG